MIVLQPDGVRIPRCVVDLEGFRAWSRSPEFPEKGRIDWVDGELEVDMSPERLNAQGAPKAAIVAALQMLVDQRDLGVVYTDSTRLSVPEANLSAEPDVTVVFFESVRSGRVRLVPTVAGDDKVEIEGPPDLVVECVSPSSVHKDSGRLRECYWKAGVPEYWLVDARTDIPCFSVLRHGPLDYEEVSAGADGFTTSPLLGISLRLVRLAPREGLVRYRLEVRSE